MSRRQLSKRGKERGKSCTNAENYIYNSPTGEQTCTLKGTDPNGREEKVILGGKTCGLNFTL